MVVDTEAHTVDVEYDSELVTIDDMRQALLVDPPGSFLLPYPLSYANVSARQAKNLIESGVSSSVFDIREEEEYCGLTGHVPDSELLPWDSRQDDDKFVSMLPTSGQLVLICNSGNRSAEAAEWLNVHPNSGRFSLINRATLTVYNVVGGTQGWLLEAYDTNQCVRLQDVVANLQLMVGVEPDFFTLYNNDKDGDDRIGVSDAVWILQELAE